MGNSQSIKHPATSHHSLRRRGSKIWSRITLGCVSADMPDPPNSARSSQESSILVNEKSPLRGHQHFCQQHSRQSSQTAYSPDVDTTKETAEAYASFLMEYPGKEPFFSSLSQLTHQVMTERVSFNMDPWFSTPNGLCEIGAYWGNLCWLHGWRALSRKSHSRPHGLSQS